MLRPIATSPISGIVAGNIEHIVTSRSSDNKSPTIETNGMTNGASPSVRQRTANFIKRTSSLTFNDIPDVPNRSSSTQLRAQLRGINARRCSLFYLLLIRWAQRLDLVNIFFKPEKGTSAAFAALVNDAACHMVEQDDLNNVGMIHRVYLGVYTVELTVGDRSISGGICGCTRCWLFDYRISCGMCGRA